MHNLKEEEEVCAQHEVFRPITALFPNMGVTTHH